MSLLINVLLLIMSFQSLGSEFMPKGSVLTADSMVFSESEAQNLRIKIKNLEEEFEKNGEIIRQYKDLSLASDRHVDQLENMVEIKDEQIALYEKWNAISNKRISRLDNFNKLDKYEKIGAFILGAAATYGSILIADKVNDKITQN